MNFLEIFEKQNKSLILLSGFSLIGLIGSVDFLTGYEFAFSVFYVIPIAFVTWFTNRQLGLLSALACGGVWLGADLATGHPYSNPFIPLWNTCIRLSFFVIITLLLATLKTTTEHEKELARTDYLTGAVNSRHFFELAQMEIDRAQRYRHPFTLVYLDLDNFKAVNDQFGHTTGDQALCVVAGCAKKNLRKIDVVARLGGDEFALLLPETGPEAAQMAIAKLQTSLLEEMRQHNWPITFSVGVLTCATAPASVDELIRNADELMYAVKHGRKNAVEYATYTR